MLLLYLKKQFFSLVRNRFLLNNFQVAKLYKIIDIKSLIIKGFLKILFTEKLTYI